MYEEYNSQLKLNSVSIILCNQFVHALDLSSLSTICKCKGTKIKGINIFILELKKIFIFEWFI